MSKQEGDELWGDELTHFQRMTTIREVQAYLYAKARAINGRDLSRKLAQLAVELDQYLRNRGGT